MTCYDLPTEIEIEDSVVRFNYLELNNIEVATFFKNLSSVERIQQAQKAIEIGVIALSRVNTSQTVDYFNTKIAELLTNVQSQFLKFDYLMKDLLVQNLDPSKSDSFLGKTQLVIGSQLEKVNLSLSEVIKDARNLIINEASKIQIGRENLDKKMDPSNNLGYLSAVIQKMDEFEKSLKSQFSESDTASFIGKLKQIIATHFGDNGSVLQLIDKKLVIDVEGKTPLSQVYFGLKSEIASLRDAMMKLSGQQELIESTSQKGFTFEKEVFEELQRIAQPFSDVTEDTSLRVEAITGSKKGDFVYSIIDTKKSIVIDAKNYNRLKSLPAMLEYLKEAMQERNSKFGIIVAPSINSLQKQIGVFNIYDNCIICALDSLEIAIKYAKYAMQFQETDNLSINKTLIKQKLTIIERKTKEFTNLKSKLTKLNNGINSSIADLQGVLESLRFEIHQILQDIFVEINK